MCDHKSIMEQIQREQDAELGNHLLKDIAFVGRSNVGKSSLINAILGVQAAKTSKTPGKTRDIQFYPLVKKDCRLIDCPGYGYARAS